MMTQEDLIEVLAYMDMRDREPSAQEVLADFLEQLEEARERGEHVVPL